MKVQVVNDNDHPYREKFRGKEIVIPAKGSIEMDYNEAHIFLGTMPSNIEVDGNGIQKATSYKRLSILTGNEAPTASSKKFKCMADGREFASQAELDAYIAENHVEAMVDEDAKKKVVAKRGKPPKGG